MVSNIRTCAELARLCGVSREAARHWPSAKGWQWGPPPWPESILPAVRAWRQARIDRAHGEPELTTAQVEIVRNWSQAEYEAFMQEVLS